MTKGFLFLLIPLLHFGQTQVGLDIDGGIGTENSGWSTSISNDGTIVAIGAPGNTASHSGYTRVYKNIAGSWTKLGSDISGEMIYDRSGKSVALSGDSSTLAIGAITNKGNYGSGSAPGHVRVFKNVAGKWTQIGNDIDGEEYLENSGYSVSLSDDGSIVAIGAVANFGNGPYSGHVRVYKNISGTWTQIGNDIDGKNIREYSGWSVSLSSDGSIVAIGSPYNNYDGTNAGQVRVFKNINGMWSQIGSDINGLTANEFSGKNVSLSKDGNTLAIAALQSSIVRIYKNVLGTWTQIGNDINDGEKPDGDSRNISLSGDGIVLAIGAPNKSGNAFTDGRVRLYKNVTGVWTQIGIDIYGEAAQDGFGSSVSLSSDGTFMAVGAPYNDRRGTDSGHVRVYNLLPLLSTDDFVLSKFTVYPNPSSDKVIIVLESNLILEKINVYNTLGQLIKTEKNNIVSVTSLSKGNYYFEVITNLGKATRIVMVK